jgi:hypothetical protein
LRNPYRPYSRFRSILSAAMHVAELALNLGLIVLAILVYWGVP